MGETKTLQHKPDKEEFQIERIAFFSDAVFAIAITLLIIEIKVPELHRDSSKSYDVQYVINLYWMVHHRLFNYIVHYNPKLMGINLTFLLSIVIMPFSTAFFSDSFIIQAHTPLAFYTLNICFTAYMGYRLWKVASHSKYNLSKGLDNKILFRYNTIRAFTIPSIFVLVFIVSFINSYVAFFVLPLLPFVSFFINRYYKKNYPELMKEHLERA